LLLKTNTLINQKEELVSQRFLQKNLKVIQIVFKWYRILKNRKNLKQSQKNKNSFVDSYLNNARSINHAEIKEIVNIKDEKEEKSSQSSRSFNSLKEIRNKKRTLPKSNENN
jgi:hypothetical protein